MTALLTPTDPSWEKTDSLFRKGVSETELTCDRFVTLPSATKESKSKGGCLKGFFAPRFASQVDLDANVAKTEVSSRCQSQKLCINIDLILLFAKKEASYINGHY